MTHTRTLPQSLETERAVLGAIWWDQKLIRKALAGITAPEVFYTERHRLAWKAYVELASENAPINIVSVRDRLRRSGDLEKVGGEAYLASFDVDMPDVGGFDGYLEELRDLRAARQAIAEASELTKSLFDPPANGDRERVARVAEILEDHAGKMRDIRTARAGLFETVDARDIAERWSAEKPEREPPGIRWGIPLLDSHSRIRPGDSVVICGQTGHGKSSFAQQVAWGAMCEAKRVLFISLEMLPRQVVGRFVTQISGGPYRAWEEPWREDEKTQNRIAHGAAEFADVLGDLIIEPPGAFTVEAVEARAQIELDRGGLDLVIVDYLQLLQIPTPKGWNRADAIGRATGTLKRMAMRLEVPVITLSQFSRDPSKENRRPRLADLRGSGMIENDADTVVAPWIPLVDGQQPVQGDAELIVMKQRGGEPGTIPAFWHGPSMRYHERETRF